MAQTWMQEKQRSQKEPQVLVLSNWKLIFLEIGKLVEEVGWGGEGG